MTSKIITTFQSFCMYNSPLSWFYLKISNKILICPPKNLKNSGGGGFQSPWNLLIITVCLTLVLSVKTNKKRNQTKTKKKKIPNLFF